MENDDDLDDKENNQHHDDVKHNQQKTHKKNKKYNKKKEEARHRALHKNHDKRHGDHNDKHEFGEKGLYYISLVLGKWRKQIPHFYRRVLIATALNTCIKNDKFKIYGYLITSKRVFLILKSHHKEIEHKLESFEDYLGLEIEHYHIKIESNHQISHDGDYKVKKHVFGNLFEMYPLYNDSLVRLLTGRKPKIKYYDPGLAKMEDIIQNYEFCSVLDYEAYKTAKKMKFQHKRNEALVGSAVLVKVKKKSFWKKHKTTN